MENLKSKEMMVIRLHYLGRSYKEISKQTGIPINTLWKWLCRKGRLYYAYVQYASKINKHKSEEFEKIIMKGMN